MTSTADAEIYGLRVMPITRRELETRVFDDLAAAKGGWIVTANLEILRQFTDSAEVRGIVSRAELTVVDGTPLVWAARVARRPVPERVAGSDLISSLSEGAALHRRRVFFLGGAPGAAEAAAAALGHRFAGLEVAGTLCPEMGFTLDDATVESIAARLAQAQPDIVFVGLPFPKQERLIERLRPTLPQAWFLGCGVAIEFAAGYVERAPSWSHGLGLEWAFRLMREPRKLFRRYVILGLPFATRVGWWAVTTRWRR